MYRIDERLVARNRPTTEETSARVSEDQLGALFAGLNYRIVQGSVQAGRSLVSEIWRGFVVLLLAVLIAESVLVFARRPTQKTSACMNATREITFDVSPAIVLLAAAVLVVISVLAWLAWRKSGFDRAVGGLELLRLLIAMLAVLTFCQPEWKEIYEPIEQPVLAILPDDSPVWTRAMWSIRTRSAPNPWRDRLESSRRCRPSAGIG